MGKNIKQEIDKILERHIKYDEYYEHESIRTIGEKDEEIESLRKQLEMKRDDWLEVCKENNALQERVNFLEETFIDDWDQYEEEFEEWRSLLGDD